MANPWHIGGVVALSLILAGGLAWAFYGGSDEPSEILLEDEEELDGPLSTEELQVADPGVTNEMNRIAILHTNKGDIRIELFEDTMPITTGNFVELAEQGFYDSTKFHRIIDNFMVQGGDPNSKSDDRSSYGTGGPDYTIQDEFVEGNLLTNTRGTIAMANTGQPNSGGSQFFINTVNNTSLDFDKDPFSSRHPVFGRVVEGMSVVDKISNVETDGNDIPIEPVVVESVEIISQNE